MLRYTTIYSKGLLICLATLLFATSSSNANQDSIAKPTATELVGPTYRIEETDAIETIQNRLKHMQQSGELARLENEAKGNIEKSILEPKPIDGVMTVEKGAVRYFDPTWVLNQDLYDDAGNVMAKQGTAVNPLDVMPIRDKLFFFDGRDRAQVELAKAYAAKYGSDFTPILTAGSWTDLSNELQRAVYFDQMGKMTQRLTITAVPALVMQEGKLMKIEEIKP